MPSLNRSYDNHITSNLALVKKKTSSIKSKKDKDDLNEGEEKSDQYNIDLSSLSGYLYKDKSNVNTNINPTLSFLQSKSNRRYFRVLTMQGMEGDELAVAYYKAENSKDIKGWIFSKDIIEINEDKMSFTIISPSRSLTCRADSGKEHNLWVNGLRSICPGVRFISDGVEVSAGDSHLSLPSNIKEENSDDDIDDSMMKIILEQIIIKLI